MEFSIWIFGLVLILSNKLTLFDQYFLRKNLQRSTLAVIVKMSKNVNVQTYFYYTRFLRLKLSTDVEVQTCLIAPRRINLFQVCISKTKQSRSFCGLSIHNLIPWRIQNISFSKWWLNFSSFSGTVKGRMGLGLASTESGKWRNTPERSNIASHVRPCAWVSCRDEGTCYLIAMFYVYFTYLLAEVL